jgi:hypothetical protein
LDSEVRAGSFLGIEDPIWAVYAGVEVRGRRDRVRREGGLVWPKKTKNRAMGARFWLAITVVPSH